MGAVDETGAPAGLTHGSRCPICNKGVLYVIAISDAGLYLRCFNCETSATVSSEREYQPVIADDVERPPAGFQLTQSQLDAKREAGIDPFSPHDLAAVATAPAPTPAEPAEPHEQHDVVPPDDDPGKSRGGRGG